MFKTGEREVGKNENELTPEEYESHYLISEEISNSINEIEGHEPRLLREFDMLVKHIKRHA